MGRGVLYGLIARGLFILGAYVVHVYAGRVLQPERYGTLGVILAILTLCAIFYSNGVREAVARHIATAPQSGAVILAKGLQVQLGIGLPLAGLLVLLAQDIAMLFQDPGLVLPLQLCAAVIVLQCLYYLYLGAINGQRRFLAESVVGIVYSVARPVAVVALIALGYGVLGAVWGFVLASAVAAAVGYAMRGRLGHEPAEFKIRDVFAPATHNILVFGAITCLLNMDLLFVKGLLSQADAAGLYTAAVMFSKPPYWLMFSFGAVALPLVAACYARGDVVQCRLYLSQVMRYSLLLVLPLAVIMAATAEPLLVFFYTQAYAEAHASLSILMLGGTLIGMLGILAHVMIAIGRERLMAVMAMMTAALDSLLNLLLIPPLGLLGAALATSLSALALLLACGIYLARCLGLGVSPWSLLRIGAVSVLLFFASQVAVVAQMPLIVQYIVLYLGFAIALLLVGEIGRADWGVVKRLIHGKKPDETEAQQL